MTEHYVGQDECEILRCRILEEKERYIEVCRIVE